jgi:mycofactocin system glycosyltransferase
VAGRWQGGGVVQAGEERFARTLIQQGLLHPHFAGTFNNDEIDVIVPAFENVSSLRVLLGQLKEFHVTVVDDDSSNADDVAACAEEFGATLLRLDRNQGPAHARNVAGVASTREFLWFVDDDVSMSNATDVAERLRLGFADPLLAVVAPRVCGPKGPSIRERFEQHFSPLDIGERSGLVVPGGPIGFVPSACLMVRREAFGDGFDETMRVGEDVDFVWRLFDRGWLVRYDAGVVVTHRARDTWRGWWIQRQRYGASSGELARRHGERLAPLRADPWTLLAWFSVLAGQPAWGARIVRSARNHARDRFFTSADDPNRVANEVVVRNMVRAGAPLARALVRTFGIVLLVAALHPRLRSRALSAFALGTAWRWRHHRVHVTDLPLAIADDLAYGVGVIEGAWSAKSFRSLTPAITKSSMGFREALGLASP